MKEEKKIIPFSIPDELLDDPEMDAMLLDSIIKEADQLEAELNQKPELERIETPEGLFDSIVNELKDKRVWKETDFEQKKDTLPEEESASVAEQTEEERLAAIYAMLPESDRQALELGKRISKKKEDKILHRRSRTKLFRNVGIVAAAMVMLLGVSMTSDANRRLVKQAWDGVMRNFNFALRTNNIDKDNYDQRNRNDKEVEAMQRISEEVGTDSICFQYLPEGMSFADYEILTDSQNAVMFYEYQGKYINVFLINIMAESSQYLVADEKAELVDTVYTMQKIPVKIWRMEEGEQGEILLAEFQTNQSSYSIQGYLSLEEMKKVIEGIIF